MGQAIGGVASGITSLFGGRARRREERAAQAEFDQQKQAFDNFQFQNQFANLENTAEDLTVNQQAANFQAQQTDAALAQGLDAVIATGGGGGGAQAIANAALQAKQGISADISRQEQANQQQRARQAARNQQLEAQGADQLQQQQYDHTSSLYSLSSQRLGAARAARQQATRDLVGGIVSGATLAGAAGAFGEGGFQDAAQQALGYDFSGQGNQNNFRDPRTLPRRVAGSGAQV